MPDAEVACSKKLGVVTVKALSVIPVRGIHNTLCSLERRKIIRLASAYTVFDVFNCMSSRNPMNE